MTCNIDRISKTYGSFFDHGTITLSRIVVFLKTKAIGFHIIVVIRVENNFNAVSANRNIISRREPTHVNINGGVNCATRSTSIFTTTWWKNMEDGHV